MSYNQYSLNELADVHLVYGECNSNSLAAARRYAEKYPNRLVPYPSTFAAVDRKIREKGTLLANAIVPERQRPVRSPDLEEAVLNSVEENPNTSVRRLSSEFEVSRSTIHRILQEQLLYPYRLNRIHEILPQDCDARSNFCHWLLDRQNEDNRFVRRILMTDEASFTNNGMINRHNSHTWSDVNPHATFIHHRQHRFSINVWAGIVDNYLIGPVELPERLNGPTYLHFLEHTLPELLEDVDLQTRGNMWYMHDGAPAHFSLEVRRFLSNRFPRRWIGRGQEAPINWPARSPDLNMLDFYFWGYMKTKVYATHVRTPEELWERIQSAADIVRQDGGVLFSARRSLIRRANLCVQVNGEQFEHLL